MLVNVEMDGLLDGEVEEQFHRAREVTWQIFLKNCPGACFPRVVVAGCLYAGYPKYALLSRTLHPFIDPMRDCTYM